MSGCASHYVLLVFTKFELLTLCGLKAIIDLMPSLACVLDPFLL